MTRQLQLIVATVLVLGCRSVPEGFEGPPTPWASMDHDQRVTYMTATVSPMMAKSFKGFDAERYADFGCRTCHGSGADDGSYTMPNPDLPVLNHKTFRKEHQKKHPEMVRFMWEHVEIETAALLGQKTGRKHFSCRSCHVRE